MKVQNKGNSSLSFPTLGLHFKAGEIKEVAEKMAVLLLSNINIRKVEELKNKYTK